MNGLHPFLSDRNDYRNCSETDFHRDERGGLTFSAGIVIIGMAILIGMVGNIGSEVVQKQRLQIAADSAAYSSAVWMARGMNTVCTINHLMGELTAFVVVLEAIGGPEAGNGGIPPQDFPSDEKNVWDPWIKKIEELADGSEATLPEAPIVGMMDKLLMPAIKKLLIYENGESRKCGAAILDAELTLKVKYLKCLGYKVFANACCAAGRILEVAAGLGEILVCVGIGIHLASDALIACYLFEAVLLKALSFFAVIVAPIKKVIRKAIPLLSDYGDQMAGIGGMESLRIKKPMEETIKKIEKYYKLKRLEYMAHSQKITLPIVPEKSPFHGTTKPDCPKWGTDKDSNTLEEMLGFLLDKPLKIIATINDWLSGVVEIGLEVIGFVTDIFGGSDKVDKVKDAVKNVREALKKVGEFISLKYTTAPDHPSLKKLKEFDIEKTKTSQWVRATYPYVDSIRAGIRNWAVNSDATLNRLNLSNFSTHFTDWCYRYTLNESYCLQVGGGSDYGKSSHMYIMKDSSPTKGGEKWTTLPSLAESYFAIIVRAESSAESAVFAPSIFSSSNKKKKVAYAQAMFYAANEQTFPNNNQEIQANIAWDTLQWKPSVKAPEWRSKNPAHGNSHWPHEFLTGIDLSESAKVKINWQAKLVPLSKEMIGNIEKDQRWIMQHTKLITH